MSIKEVFFKYLNLGADKNTSKTELKKIKLFNVFCLGWQILSVVMAVDEYKEHSSFSVILLSIAMSSAIFIIQYIHYKQHLLLGRILYLMLLIGLTYWYANYLFNANLLEFYFFLVFSKSLVFIDSKKINLFILFIAFTCFFIPNFFFHHYPIPMFNDVSIAFLFFAIFIIINYFKTLNANNEAELESKKNDLEKINEFQSQFFINISHEIRTPLTLIKGQIEKLKNDNLSKNDLKEVEFGVNAQVSKIKKMVDDVLDLAKMETSDFKLNFKNTSLKQLINRIILNFEPLFKEKNIEFTFINNEDYFTESDTVYLERALNNILINALKYTERNGKVTISLTAKNEDIIIKIKDSGIGISEKEIEKIFVRFYQADNSINKSGGSGVGLAFSKEIIELHQGKLTVKSELNKGSVFKIILPISKNTIDKNVVISTSKEKSFKFDKLILNQKSYNFLIVDDNKEMRNYLVDIFKENNCLQAENGIEALQVLEAHKIDFIITDYMMPKLNGLDFIKKLKPKYPNIPVIMLTARSDSKSKLDVLQLGIDDYLEKPFEKDELMIRVQNSLHNYQKRKMYRVQENIEIQSKALENWTSKVSTYISKNATNTSLKQEDIAEQFNLSKSSLYRKIKSETGLTPKEFITEVKLQKARSILEVNTSISLKQLSSEVGFLHNSYFSTLFQKRFGISPTAFSKLRK
jgi:signal transduction histidine kinase/DNA-binding response OmpR family regulator